MHVEPRRVVCCLFAAVALMVVTGSSAVAQEADEPEAPLAYEIKAVALNVGDPTLGDIEWEGWPQVNPGTQLSVLIKGFAKDVMAVSDDDSKIEHFVDGMGNDLTKRQPKGLRRFMHHEESIADHATVSEDRTALVVRFSGPRAPAPGSDRVHLVANLAVTVAGGQIKARSAPIEPGDAMKIAGHAFTTETMKPTDWDAGLLRFKVKMSMDTYTHLKSIRLLDGEGKEISDSPNGRSWGGDDASVSFTLRGQREKVIVEVVCFTELETLTVPIDLNVGMDLRPHDEAILSDRTELDGESSVFLAAASALRERADTRR